MAHEEAIKAAAVVLAKTYGPPEASKRDRAIARAAVVAFLRATVTEPNFPRGETGWEWVVRTRRELEAPDGA